MPPSLVRCRPGPISKKRLYNSSEIIETNDKPNTSSSSIGATWERTKDGRRERRVRYVQSVRDTNSAHCRTWCIILPRWNDRRWWGPVTDRTNRAGGECRGHRRRGTRKFRRRIVGGLRRRCKWRIGWRWGDDGWWIGLDWPFYIWWGWRAFTLRYKYSLVWLRFHWCWAIFRVGLNRIWYRRPRWWLGWGWRKVGEHKAGKFVCVGRGSVWGVRNNITFMLLHTTHKYLYKRLTFKMINTFEV